MGEQKRVFLLTRRGKPAGRGANRAVFAPSAGENSNGGAKRGVFAPSLCRLR